MNKAILNPPHRILFFPSDLLPFGVGENLVFDLFSEKLSQQRFFFPAITGTDSN